MFGCQCGYIYLWRYLAAQSILARGAPATFWPADLLESVNESNQRKKIVLAIFVSSYYIIDERYFAFIHQPGGYSIRIEVQISTIFVIVEWVVVVVVVVAVATRTIRMPEMIFFSMLEYQ